MTQTTLREMAVRQIDKLDSTSGAQNRDVSLIYDCLGQCYCPFMYTLLYYFIYFFAAIVVDVLVRCHPLVIFVICAQYHNYLWQYSQFACRVSSKEGGAGEAPPLPPPKGPNFL